jgi:hypothetical protein
MERPADIHSTYCTRQDWPTVPSRSFSRTLSSRNWKPAHLARQEFALQVYPRLTVMSKVSHSPDNNRPGEHSQKHPPLRCQRTHSSNERSISHTSHWNPSSVPRRVHPRSPPNIKSPVPPCIRGSSTASRHQQQASSSNHFDSIR